MASASVASPQEGVPAGERQLAGNRGGATLAAAVKDLQQVAPGGVVEGGVAPVFEDWQVETRQLLGQVGVAALPAGPQQGLGEAGQAQAVQLVQGGVQQHRFCASVLGWTGRRAPRHA
jgi:hypothetical protein